MIGTAHDSNLRATLLAMVVLAAVIMALAGARPAQAAFPDEVFPHDHGPIAFEREGDVWAATKMHLANLTPGTPDSSETESAVSTDGRYATFASDRDGDFEIYVANVFTGEAQQVTDNAVDDLSPAWSAGGRGISYRSPSYASPTHAGIFLARVKGVGERRR
jgi:hypothetical protein